MRTLRIRKGDDFHCHLREGPMLRSVIGFTARQFRRAVVMGNTVPAIVTADQAESYKQEILSATPPDVQFEPLMTTMLAKRTTPEIVAEASKRGVRILKFIPEGVSTNSEDSVALENLRAYYPVLEMAQDCDMVLSLHLETVRSFDGRILQDIEREVMALPHLAQVAKDFPNLRIVAEHASTRELLNYVRGSPARIAATLTLHHAMLVYEEVCHCDGSVFNPFNYCKPVAKSIFDYRAVSEAMMSGDPHFFFGSDSAPHLKAAKQKHPPAAGIFSAPVAMPQLAQKFDYADALGKLDNFVSGFGADFYGLRRNSETIELVRDKWVVPQEYEGIVPFLAGHTLHWKVAE